MFEKSNYQETPSASVRPMPAKSTPVVKTTDVAEPSLIKARKKNVAPEIAPISATVIGLDVVFKGELIAGDDVFIHGTIEGTIARQTKNVIVGKEGRVTALIHAASVTVQGRVDGDIYGDDIVDLMEGATVNGNIYCPCIRVEKGAQFNGTISMA